MRVSVYVSVFLFSLAYRCARICADLSVAGPSSAKNKDRKKTGTAVNIPTVATIVFTVVGVFILGFLFTVSFYCVQISKKIPASNTSEP